MAIAHLDLDTCETNRRSLCYTLGHACDISGTDVASGDGHHQEGQQERLLQVDLDTCETNKSSRTAAYTMTKTENPHTSILPLAPMINSPRA